MLDLRLHTPPFVALSSCMAWKRCNAVQCRQTLFYDFIRIVYYGPSELLPLAFRIIEWQTSCSSQLYDFMLRRALPKAHLGVRCTEVQHATYFSRRVIPPPPPKEGVCRSILPLPNAFLRPVT